MIKIVVSNQRGGVGKTTTTLSLARYLADRGRRVLVVDTDPQGSIAVTLGLKPTSYISHFIGQRYALKEQDGILNPDHIADSYWMLHTQPRDAWTHELDLRPWLESW